MTSPTVITDDEFVALAYLAGVSPDRPVPTLDLGDVKDTSKAVARGIRSLGLRGWLPDESQAAPTAGLDAAVGMVTGAVRLVGSTVDDEFRVVVSDERFEWVQTSKGGGLLVGVSPSGVYTFKEVTSDDALTAFADILRERFSSDIDDGVFCVVAHDQAGHPVAGCFASTGELRSLVQDGAGGLTPGSPIAVDEMTEWVVEHLEPSLAE